MTRSPRATTYRAVLFDFGGVVLTSPFDAFNEYERANGLPHDFIRGVNARDPDSNAWARLERAELDSDGFDSAFGDESALLGRRVPGAAVIALLAGSIRDEMVEAIEDVRRRGLLTACLTNNVVNSSPQTGSEIAAVMSLFDDVVESSVIGVRKPEPRFYEIACERLDVDAEECIFLDDLGVNLKPARAMGMTTIKVTSGPQAVAELRAALDGQLD
ncbi:MAG: HAD-IA family hydrolase [Actinomycetota bacterium]|nr:HAD-IA family hydrolase [Actinomycetota bacterium]